MADHTQLLAITPLDGRYADKAKPLGQILSEFGLIKRRVAVEVAWYSLLGSGVLPDFEAFSEEQRTFLRTIVEQFSLEDAADIKDIEKTTNHDVKAVELWLRKKLQATTKPSFKDTLELVHFGITSEDINNIAYSLQVRDTRDQIIRPALEAIIGKLETQAEQYAVIPLLARTHGQPATPTTLGKELKVFVERLSLSKARLDAIAIYAKFNGATGNYNALTVAYPDIDWIPISQQLIEAFEFSSNLFTTQIEPHDWLAAFCNELALTNTILTDLARDIWLYISRGYFAQEVKDNEVGSSTMPHKVNPIDFENAEANFGIANALLTYLATKLPVSRLQRDLSDSSSLRSLGEALGHMYVAMVTLSAGLSKITANPQAIAQDLDQEWSVLTEAVQTMMRRYKVENAYEIIKSATRGKSLNREEYLALVESLELPAPDKQFLQNLTPQTYIGQAVKLAQLKTNGR